MFSKSGYNYSLKELIKANKADKSVASVIKENLSIQADAKNNIKKTEREIKRLNVTGEDKKSIKMQTPIYNIKNYMNILLEIRGIKKQLKQKNNEVKVFNKKMEKAELQNSEIEKEIESQYKIYQENEIFTKAIEKINKSKYELSEKDYNSYLKHVDAYNNSIYSIEKKSKLPEPNADDFVVILNVLMEIEKSQNNKKTRKAVSKDKKEESKAKATKNTTSKEKKENSKTEVTKKTTAKKTANKEDNKVEAAKTTKNKNTTGKENKEDDKIKTTKKTTTKKTASKENKEDTKIKTAKKETTKKNTSNENKEENKEIAEKKSSTKKTVSKDNKNNNKAITTKKVTTKKATSKDSK